jgi:hypothetical protein
MLPAAKPKEAETILAKALGLGKKPLIEVHNANRSGLTSSANTGPFGGKAENARERYANFILPRWNIRLKSTDRNEDGFRDRYIGLFTGSTTC